MTFPDFIYRFDGFSNFLVNAIICVLAAKLYQDTRRRCLLPIAIGSGLTSVLIVLPELEGTLSWGAWYFEMFLRITSNGIWLIGCWLLFRDYANLIRTSAQSGGAPNVGPATPGS